MCTGGALSGGSWGLYPLRTPRADQYECLSANHLGWQCSPKEPQTNNNKNPTDIRNQASCKVGWSGLCKRLPNIIDHQCSSWWLSVLRVGPCCWRPHICTTHNLNDSCWIESKASFLWPSFHGLGKHSASCQGGWSHQPVLPASVSKTVLHKGAMIIPSYISNLIHMPTERVATTPHQRSFSLQQREAIAESYSWTHVAINRSLGV